MSIIKIKLSENHSCRLGLELSIFSSRLKNKRISKRCLNFLEMTIEAICFSQKLSIKKHIL